MVLSSTRVAPELTAYRVLPHGCAHFLNAAGTKTGKVFPTDNQIDYFDDVPVTCIDMAMPVVIIPAEYLGKTGYELPAELDADKALLARIESIRLQAGKAMGLGDVSNMVIPKPVLISPAQKGGAINVRYFMPHSCHRALAITVLLLFPVVVHWKVPSPDKSSLL